MHFFGHLHTVLQHKKYVFLHCVKAGIVWQGIVHDLSKFSPAEFINSAKYYVGTGSPIPREREVLGFSKVWMHHSKKNKHHVEYWIDNDKGNIIHVKMPLRYVKEMFCDMLSADKVYLSAAGSKHNNSTPLEYYRKIYCSCKRMHDDTAALLEKLFVMLSEEGEDATFRYIRKLKEKDY
ncbi:MAG: catalase [Clostridia bacterium]|nr:catalase [Clostridia bacterium]